MRHIKRAPRVDSNHAAILATSDGHVFPVTITDLSSGGFRLQCSELLRIGEYAGLNVDNCGEFSGQIRWALGNEAGGVFLERVVLAN